MRTAIGAPDPGDFERNQPHNLFNDRRIGGKSKNRAVAQSIFTKKNQPKLKPDKNQRGVERGGGWSEGPMYNG
jgi:hypothetical protein